MNGSIHNMPVEKSIEDMPGEKIMLLERRSRFVVARQLLTTFANRTYGYRIPCLQGLIAFGPQADVVCPLSARIPQFEEALWTCEAKGTGTRLWDAIKLAAEQLQEEVTAIDPTTRLKRYPRAALRILVISDGDDTCSIAKPWDVGNALRQANIVLDAVILTDTDCDGKRLALVAHMTGGLAFQPEKAGDCLKLFEAEAFLCLKERVPDRKSAVVVKELEEQLKKNRMGEVVFDTEVRSLPLKSASCSVVLSTPKSMVVSNTGQVALALDERKKRILRELRNVCATEDERDREGHPNPLYNRDLHVIVEKASLDKWRVYMRPPEHTKYSGKWWYLYVTFPFTYPASAPVIRFVSVPYHLNVASDGRICLSKFDQDYQSNVTVVTLLKWVSEMFEKEDTSALLELERNRVYWKDPRHHEYYHKASESSANAKDDLAEWYDEKDVRHVKGAENMWFTVDLVDRPGASEVGRPGAVPLVPKPRPDNGSKTVMRPRGPK
jgi:ubiquitin-protein ligase